MKLMSYAEINDLENGQQIPSLTGRVKKVFDQLTDVGQYGQWWLQSFIMTDDHGVELRCTWSGEDTVNNLEGKDILIESGHDKKEQLAGIKKEIKNKNGKHYETVKLDDRCKIKTLGSGDSASDRQNGGTDARCAPSSTGVASSEGGRQAAQSSSNGVDEARKHLMQSANLLNLCVDAVNNAVAPFVPDIAQTEEFFQAQVATLFIEASRNGLVAKMPTSPVHKAKAPTTARQTIQDFDEDVPF